MSLFGPDPSEVPYPPIDVPTPNIPAANFAEIGAQLEKGKQSVSPTGGILGSLIDLLPKIIGIILGAAVNLILKIIAYLMTIWNAIWAQTEDSMTEVSAQAVGGLFGVSVPPSSFGALGNPNARVATAATVANAVFAGLGFDPNTNKLPGVAPSSAGAAHFIQTATHLAIEGWLQGWIFEAISAGQIETFAELKDIMAHVLGLGRMAHTVLHPIVKVSAVDPLTYLVNSNLRPKLYGEADGVRAYLRGLLSQADLHTHLMYQGYSDTQIENAIKMGGVHLGPSQLQALVDHGVIDDATARQKLKDQGYDDFTANAALQLVSLEKHDGIVRKLASATAEAYIARKIDDATLQNNISILLLPKTEADLMIEDARVRRTYNVTRPALGEGATLVKKGIWGVNDFEALAVYHGYGAQDELDLELLLLEELKETADAASAKAKAAAAKAKAAADRATAAIAKAAAVAAAEEAKGVSVAEFQALVKLGLKTIGDYKAYLVAKGVAADNVAALVAAFQLQLDATKANGAATQSASAAAKARNLSLAQLDQATKAGILSTDEYKARLIQAGVSEGDSQILVELLADQIAAAKLKADAAAAKKAAAPGRGLNLAQEELGVELGLQSMAQYGAFLEARGYDAADIATLTSELQTKVDKLKNAAAAKPGVATAAKIRGLNIAQVEKLVRAGQRPIADYTAALASLGYDADTQQALTSLLDLQMRADQEELAATGRASALIGQRSLSLAQLANAVVQGVIDMSVYTDALARAGVAAADVQILQLALAAKIATKKKGTTAAASTAKLVAAAGLSLPTLEKDFIGGKLTVDQLTNLLETAGVGADAIASLVALLQNELANEQALKELTGVATAKAAARGLSLGEETAAVKAGVKTIDDYSSFVASLGFGQSDVDTLTATLATDLAKTAAAAAAKAAKQPAKPAAP